MCLVRINCPALGRSGKIQYRVPPNPFPPNCPEDWPATARQEKFGESFVELQTPTKAKAVVGKLCIQGPQAPTHFARSSLCKRECTKQRCVDWTYFKKHHIKTPSALGKLFEHRPQQQHTDPSRTSHWSGQCHCHLDYDKIRFLFYWLHYWFLCAYLSFGTTICKRHKPRTSRGLLV